MAQVPATPKLRRLRNRLMARLGRAAGPDWQPSERAALDLRQTGRSTDPATQVVFLIPLVGPQDVGDWDAITTRLAATLRQFQAQTDPRWHAVVCCQTAPPLPDDPRITHLPFSDPTPGNDKWRKLAALCRHLQAFGPAPCYAMTFDADDLLHPETVAQMLQLQAPGYVVAQGYVRDNGTRGIGLAQPPSLRQPLCKPFWKLCGSCAALRVTPSKPQALQFLEQMSQHEHRMFPYLARLADRPLHPLPFPAVLYELNHGENFGARRGRISFKARFVERFRVTDPDRLSRIAQDFPALTASDEIPKI